MTAYAGALAAAGAAVAGAAAGAEAAVPLAEAAAAVAASSAAGIAWAGSCSLHPARTMAARPAAAANLRFIPWVVPELRLSRWLHRGASLRRPQGGFTPQVGRGAVISACGG